VGDVTIELVTFVVSDYDEAIDFFVGLLGFRLVEDSPSVAENGRAKRWVVVQPSSGGTGLLLAEADGEEQQRALGNQTGGRVAFFLRVDDFARSYGRMREGGVEFLTDPRDEPYGTVAIFRDIAGNRWDLLGPRPAP
jgi:catechol 2,3-dioxygenase-like lactoylglutathione lyase family enzyme